MIVPVKLAKNAYKPTYATPGSAGMDLYATEDALIHPGAMYTAHIGVSLQIPSSYEGQVRIRSSWAKKGLIVPNSPGTIDSDYRGDICILLRNVSQNPVIIERGARIAQIVFCPIVRAELSIVYELEPSTRGSGGFGSTGR